MKKFNKEMLIEIIGAVILLALIGGIVSCNTVCSYDPSLDSNVGLNGVPDYALSN